MADYTPTEAEYKGGAEEMYVTYDLQQKTRGGGTATYPKVKRVYIAGKVRDWDVGDFEKQSGRTVHGVKIEYSQTREGYEAERGGTEYQVDPSTSRYAKIVEIPDAAENAAFRGTELPEKYRSALQDVR